MEGKGSVRDSLSIPIFILMKFSVNRKRKLRCEGLPLWHFYTPCAPALIARRRPLSPFGTSAEHPRAATSLLTCGARFTDFATTPILMHHQRGVNRAWTRGRSILRIQAPP